MSVSLRPASADHVTLVVEAGGLLLAFAQLRWGIAPACVWEQNPRAIVFYRKWGFTQVGEHCFAVGDDPQRDVILEREL